MVASDKAGTVISGAATTAGVSSTFLQADKATHDIKASVKTRMEFLLISSLPLCHGAGHFSNDFNVSQNVPHVRLHSLGFPIHNATRTTKVIP
jgi:hypothetical protein